MSPELDEVLSSPAPSTKTPLQSNSGLGHGAMFLKAYDERAKSTPAVPLILTLAKAVTPTRNLPLARSSAPMKPQQLETVDLISDDEDSVHKTLKRRVTASDAFAPGGQTKKPKQVIMHNTSFSRRSTTGLEIIDMTLI